MTPHLLRTPTGPVEVAEAGSGPAVLVVHGTPGDWSQAVALAQDLAPHHRVLLPSRPGYGRTPLAVGRSPVEQAHAYAAVLDALDVDSAAVVGISGGGPSSRAFALHHRERCTHLALLCAVASHLVTVPLALRLLSAVPGLWEAGARVSSRNARRRLADRAATVAAALGDLGPAERQAIEQDPRVTEDLLSFLAHNARVRRSVAGMRNDFRWFSRVDAREPWPPGDDLPVLVLHGDVDPVVPLAHGQDHAAGIPGAVLEVLEGAGHSFPLTMRRSVSTRLLPFLQERAKESA